MASWKVRLSWVRVEASQRKKKSGVSAARARRILCGRWEASVQRRDWRAGLRREGESAELMRMVRVRVVEESWVRRVGTVGGRSEVESGFGESADKRVVRISRAVMVRT